MKALLTLGSVAVDEPVGSRAEVTESPSVCDEAELVPLEDDLTAIEDAMERVERGDLDGYEAVIAQFDNPGRSSLAGPGGVEEPV